ncbi:uncharacterized protein EAE98_008662 [Botrytis deweyae]|uniref:RanBP2-type domain-containing protein n=1 Tax=Botrytis deweyae TaxID=2478750 RepID=A0ABQ7IE61_9HELO|nr:uncharacterized protein EAE98_008662 [Botrytis deweyae]KAF7921236.1 hypothetical protein EAE98_008662 [Botrytis deweyae]
MHNLSLSRPVWAANENSCTTCIPSEFRVGRAEPTTIPKITATLGEETCPNPDHARQEDWKVCGNDGVRGQCKTTISVYPCGDIHIHNPQLCIWCNTPHRTTWPKVELKVYTESNEVCENYSQYKHVRRERFDQIEAANNGNALKMHNRNGRKMPKYFKRTHRDPHGPGEARASTPASTSSSRHHHSSRGHRGSGSPRDSGFSPSHTF